MPIRREELFRKLYYGLNGEGRRLCICKNCGSGPISVRADVVSSEPCDECEAVAWRDLTEEEFVFKTELLDYLASHSDHFLAIEELEGIASPETKTLQELHELKRDFHNFEDSMKAGQMEVLLRIEHNSRSAAALDPVIAERLGAPLYSRLHLRTQRALQLAEYYYKMNQEPDGFAPTAMMIAQGYENELNVRIFGPLMLELLASGTETYDAQGKSTNPLIRRGKASKNGLTLGNFAWYLREDSVVRSKVAALGFDVEAISKDAGLVGALRNRPAHDFSCDRTVADELRRKILFPDGVLRRLHPTVTTA
jgi:hypothetical protein